MSSSYVNVAGNYLKHRAGWHRVGEPAPDEILTVTVVLMRRESAPGDDLVERCLSHEAVCDLDQLGSSGNEWTPQPLNATGGMQKLHSAQADRFRPEFAHRRHADWPHASLGVRSLQNLLRPVWLPPEWQRASGPQLPLPQNELRA